MTNTSHPPSIIQRLISSREKILLFLSILLGCAGILGLGVGMWIVLRLWHADIALNVYSSSFKSSL